MRDWQPKLFPEYLADYSARRKRASGHSPALSTLRTKEGQLHTVTKAIGIGHDDEEGVAKVLGERDDALALIETLLRGGMTSGGVRNLTFTLMDYGEYLHRKGVGAPPALKASDAPRPNPQGVIRTFTPTEVELLITAARGVSLRWFAFIATLAETGRRPGEVLNLEWEWARLEGDTPHFILPTTKTRRPQFMPLTKRLMDEVYTPEYIALLRAGKGGALRRFQRSPEQYVFAMSYTSVNGQWQRFTERLGLENRGGLHKLRHSKATQLLTAGVPIHSVARLLGHASVTTTMRAYDGTSALSFGHYLDEV